MFSIKESLKYGWLKFKENFSFCLSSTFLVIFLGYLINEEGNNNYWFLFNIIIIFFILIVRIGYIKTFLRIYDNQKPIFFDLFKEYKLFFKYLAVSILVSLVTLAGLLLLLVPGIIWAVRFSFSPIILVDKKIGPIMAMKESYAITKGIFWKLILFALSIIGLNMLGFLALLVGMLISIPISLLATVYVYRKISSNIKLSTNLSVSTLKEI